MDGLFEDAIEITETAYEGYRIVKAENGWKILGLNKIFSNTLAAEKYIRDIHASIEELYIDVCSGNMHKIKTYFDSKKTAKLNRRYKTCRGEVSLLMTALRNKWYDMCTYLIGIGETVTDEEFDEIRIEASHAIAVVHIFHMMQGLKDIEI